MSKPPQRHLFVIGFFRSGTSLLYSFLNLHPQIKLLYEADLLGNALTSVSSRCGLKWWERLNFYNSCLQRHNLQPDASWNNAHSARAEADILYRQYAGPDPLYIGEKSPSYYDWLPRLARDFPDARILMIWRDPAAVIGSIVQAGRKDHFFSSYSLPLRSLLGFERMQADTLRLRAAGMRIFDLCYEDLIQDPETILRSVCVFLELPFDPQMLELGQADYGMFPPGEHHLKAKSGRIHHEATPRQPLPARLIEKIERYRARWKKLFAHQLATRRYWRGGIFPSRLELLVDRALCALQCLYSERFIPVIYGVLPLTWLAAYRRSRAVGFARNVSARAAALPQPLTLSVITPSYKQLPWLKLCAASVADQQGVALEHIIQDAQTGPELEHWVRESSTARLYVEADSGMYDAINRGFARATGDIVCWLNSDEQYLEGTLEKVIHHFEAHPEIDVLFGDALLVDNTGSLLSYRKVLLPKSNHIQLSHLNILSCATFIRRSVLERGYLLDTRWKTIADAVWIVDLLKARIPMAVLNEPLAVFTITEKNLGQSSLAFAEVGRWQQETSRGKLWLRFGFVWWHRLSKLFNGAYWPRAITARLYTLSSPLQRVTHSASSLGFKWPRSR